MSKFHSSAAVPTLSNDEHDTVTACVFYLNGIITDGNFKLDATTFNNIELPNDPIFHDDDREIAEQALCRKRSCMTRCLPGKAEIAGRAGALEVTPEPQEGPRLE
jgi:hypothetical protein